MVGVEKKSLTEKSVKFEKQIPLKRIMIPLLNYTHDVARFKCECTPRIENDIYFSTGIYRFHKKKKKVPLVQSLVTISYRFIRLFSIRNGNYTYSVCLAFQNFML